jgi:hypothetical protein
MAGPPDPHALSVELRDQAIPVFWAHHRLDRCRRLTQDLHFLFQLTDPAPRCSQLCTLLHGDARLQAPLYQVAMPPPVQA